MTAGSTTIGRSSVTFSKCGVLLLRRESKEQVFSLGKRARANNQAVLKSRMMLNSSTARPRGINYFQFFVFTVAFSGLLNLN